MLGIGYYYYFRCCVPQVEKQKNDLIRELEDLRDKLEEEGGVKAAQVRN